MVCPVTQGCPKSEPCPEKICPVCPEPKPCPEQKPCPVVPVEKQERNFFAEFRPDDADETLEELEARAKRRGSREKKTHKSNENVLILY